MVNNTLPERFTAQLTAQGYRLSTLDLLSSDGIPADFDCLLVCGAAQDLTEAELMQLTAYLQDGGRLCAFSRYLDESTPNWNALLAGYGLSTVPGLVVEAQSGSYADGYPYYLLPQILTADATRELRSASRRVMLPLCQLCSCMNNVRRVSRSSCCLPPRPMPTASKSDSPCRRRSGRRAMPGPVLSRRKRRKAGAVRRAVRAVLVPVGIYSG